MELKMWLVKNRFKIKDFADELGISRTHLGEIMSGRRKIGASLAKFIELKTNGEVTVQELMQDIPKKEKANKKPSKPILEPKPTNRISPKGFPMERSIFDE